MIASNDWRNLWNCLFGKTVVIIERRSRRTVCEWITDISINNNGKQSASVNSREWGPPPRQKQFRERREWTHTHPCLQPTYPLNDSDWKSISAANLPAVLREVEGNERKQPSAEDIELGLCKIALMQGTIALNIRGASPSAEPTSAD